MFVFRTGLEKTTVVEKIYALLRLTSPIPKRRLKAIKVHQTLEERVLRRI